jgi:signal transduction histidine kinase
MFRKWRRARGAARAQLQFVAAAILMSAAGAIPTNFVYPMITGRSTYSWLGPLFVLLFVAIVGHAIIRHRLLDLRLVVHRSLTFAAAVLVSLLPVIAVLTYFWPQLFQHLDPIDSAIALAAIVGVSVLVPLVRDVAGRLLDRYVYRAQANYQRTVREASRALTRVLDLKVLLPFLNSTLGRATGAEGAAVYLVEEGTLRKAISEHRHDDGHFDAPAEAPAVVLRSLARLREPIVAEEVGAADDGAAAAELRQALEGLGWALVLPLVFEDVVIGAIAVGAKRSGDPFYPQDLDLLSTLANQAGIAIRNGQLYAAVVLANEYIENIVATIDSGVVAIDANQKVAMFNRAAQQLTRRSEGDTKGGPVDALPACLAEPLAATLADGEPRVCAEADLPSGDRTLPVICITSPLRDPGGATLGAVAVFSDLTPLKELERERRRVERLAYFQALASGIAHEIKNPLVAIKTFAQLVPRRAHDRRFLDDFGRIVSREIGRMEHLTDRLRTLSRPGERSLHPVDLRIPIGDAVEFLAPAFEEKRVTLRIRMTESPCAILGHAGELEQLVLNLLMNAHEVTTAGGTVSVDLEASDGRARLAVGDSGPGIPAEILEKIFEPFFTTKQRGTGLGLAICAGIAEGHGARLRAANRPEGGAEFVVDFPVPAGAPTGVAA